MKQYPTKYFLSYETDTCPRCSGSGKDNGGDCLVCLGTGQVFVCPDCEGRGANLFYNPRGRWEPCPTCDQQGILTLEKIEEYERTL